MEIEPVVPTPVVTPVSIFTPPPPPPPAVEFPLEWLLNNAAPPVQYRAITEVARLGDRVAPGWSNIPYTYRPAIELALQADVNGVWNGSILSVPSSKAAHFEGVGTVPAFRRLTEYGWDKDAPPLVHSRRVLFRLLQEDADRANLFELSPSKAKVEEELILAHRRTVREAAGAALAGAGFEGDPRLRGLARRTIERIAEFLRSPLAEKPWIRVGNKQVLHPEAAPPTFHALHLIAHMPLFQGEYHEAMELLYAYLSRPLPRQEPVQLVGTQLVNVPQVVLGDHLPHRNAVENDIPAALAWLELMARLGFLKRNETWTKMYERFVDDCDRRGIWHPHNKGTTLPKTSHPYVWPMFPLEQVQGGEERWTDVTFRIGLIARCAGRPVELI